MSELIVLSSRLSKSTERSITETHRVGMYLRSMEQVPFVTQHLIHAGMYTRTVVLADGTRFVNVLVKIATTLLIVGHVVVLANNRRFEFSGCHVLAGEAYRKQAFIARSACALSMSFAYAGKSVDEAQRMFTDQYDLLPPLSDTRAHIITVTGE